MRALPAPLARKLYAAADIIADQGLDSTKIDDIAHAAGIPKATLYYYFSGKEEILAFLLNDLLSLIAGDVARAVEAPGPARQRLSAVVTAQLHVMHQHPAVCRALVGDLGRATRLPALAAALQTAFYRPVERLLVEGARDGTLRALPDPAVGAMTVFGAVTNAGLTRAVVDGPGDPATVAAAVLDLLMSELAPTAPASPPVHALPPDRSRRTPRGASRARSR